MESQQVRLNTNINLTAGNGSRTFAPRLRYCSQKYFGTESTLILRRFGDSLLGGIMLNKESSGWDQVQQESSGWDHRDIIWK